MFKIPNHAKAMYLERREKDLADLKKALGENDLEQFHWLGHKISGSARSFGFGFLEELATRLEDLSTLTLAAHGSQIISEFELFLKQAKKSVRFDTDYHTL